MYVKKVCLCFTCNALAHTKGVECEIKIINLKSRTSQGLKLLGLHESSRYR